MEGLTGKRMEIKTSEGNMTIPIRDGGNYFGLPLYDVDGINAKKSNPVGKDLSNRVVGSTFPQSVLSCKTAAFDEIMSNKQEKNKFSLVFSSGSGNTFCRLLDRQESPSFLLEDDANSKANIFYFN